MFIDTSILSFQSTNLFQDGTLAAIGQLAYDGGTQIGCLTNFPAPVTGGCNFLFTDGLGNFGKQEPPMFDTPLYIFAADQIVDEPGLQHLARSSGGMVFLLPRLTDQQILSDMSSGPLLFLGPGKHTAGVAEVYPQMPRTLEKHFAVVGKLSADQASLELDYGFGGKVLTHHDLNLNRAHAVEGDLLRRFWAQKKLNDLLIFQKRHENEITDLGKEYNLVTPYTSLIVLERLEQYVEHHIAPPATLPDMRKKYARKVEEQGSAAKKTERTKLDHLLSMWNERVAWWNKKFNYPENFKVKKPNATGGLLLDSVNASAAPAAVMSPPAPMAVGEMPRQRSAAKSKSENSGKLEPESQPTIVIKEWDPNTPYLQALKKSPPKEAFTTYLAQRKKYAASPAFYLDCAEFFRKQKQDDVALQVLSNIAELELDNPALLRVLAYRLLQIGQLDLACDLFDQIRVMRPEEPQSFRDLAFALAKRAQSDQRRADYTRAIQLLAHVVNHTWDRFDGIEVTALMELNALWADYTRSLPQDKNVFPLDPRLKQNLDLDVRIVLTWDADLTDIDLHVTEPSEELAFYGNNRTTIGGLVSTDFTQGYGPEEYCLRKAMHGTYKIEANYYGSSAARLMGPVTVQAEVITNFGRPNEKRQNLTLRLEDKKETVKIGEIEF